MIVRFVRFIGTGQPFDYFEKKWALVKGIRPVQAFELALESVATASGARGAITMAGSGAVPKHSEAHRAAAIEIAERHMPLLEGETLVEPDSLDVLAEDAAGLHKGTLLLRRITNLSEALYFYPCTTVSGGVLFRSEAHDPDHEAVLQTMTSRPRTEIPEPVSDSADSAADPITWGAIGSTIFLGILSSVAGKIGLKAIDVAFSSLGISNPLDSADETYTKFVEAIRLQSREDFRRQIRIRLSAVERLRKDFHSGMRTEDMLRQNYNEIRVYTSWLEHDERSPDRVHLLAMAQAMYIAVMQEMAEWYRISDPGKMTEFYKAVVAAAARERDVLKTVQDEAYSQRLAKITGVHNRFDESLLDYRIAYFHDAVWPGHDLAEVPDWDRAQTRCVDRNMRGDCTRWEFTNKGLRTIEEIRVNMERHRQRIRTNLTKALHGIPQAIDGLDRISRMTIPPPPPKLVATTGSGGVQQV